MSLLLADVLQVREHALSKLADAENFERNLHIRFPGTKRFSLEGGESLIPLLDELLERSGDAGVREIVVGMAHRGRLSVLANVMNKPPHLIVEEYQDASADTVMGSGDVKYHLGYSSDHVTESGQKIHLSLTFNPSHLEAVNPVVEGRVRAKQDRSGHGKRGNCLPLLIHGDAAFAGQGLVAEVLNLSDLKGYRTGGTIHVIVNNQIGFTTSVQEARSTPYATDVARMLAIPIFHVNGEDLESLAAAVRLAVEWRQTFRQDVVIDMYCYRRFGHNEGDDPSFTQPLMYNAITKKAPVREIYARRLVESGAMSQAEVDAIVQESRDRMESLMSLAGSDTPVEEYDSPLKRNWRRWIDVDGEYVTGAPRERIVDLLTRANTIPDGFNAHRKLKRILSQRMDAINGERPLDWALGEQAAYATPLADG